MIGQEPIQIEPKTIPSPLKDVELIDTFNAARILFPQESTTGIHRRRIQRRIQRLCKRGVLEYFRVGHEYQVVKRSLYDYIEKTHHRATHQNSD